MRREVIGALLTLVIFAVIGALALIVGQPLLVPSLGPTTLVQLQTSTLTAARPWNVLAGHGVAIAAALLSLAIAAGYHTPSPILTGVLTWQRELASALAVALTLIAQAPLKATHPPAAATGLLITLGAIEPLGRALWILVAGIVLTALLGEGARLVLLKMFPHRDDAQRQPGR